MAFVIDLFAGILLTLATSVIVFQVLMLIISSIDKKPESKEVRNGTIERSDSGSK